MVSKSNIINAQADEVRDLIAAPPTRDFPFTGPIDPPHYWVNDETVHDCFEPIRYTMVEAAAMETRRRYPLISQYGAAGLMEEGMPVIKILQTDITNDFLLSPQAMGVNPGETLTVPGALGAMCSYLDTMYRYIPYIAEVISMYDSHMTYSYHSRFSYFDPQTGEHPAPFSPIWHRDLASGKIACLFGNVDPSAEEYASYIEQTYAATQPWNAVITAWPTHSQDNTINAAGHTAVERFGHCHSLLQLTNGYSKIKGMLMVENYGGLMAAMPTADANSLLDLELFRAMVRGAHWWVWKAQARTHCSVTTAMQFVDALCDLARMLNIHPQPLLRRLVVVEDWHNNIPDVVDPASGQTILPFKHWADTAFRRLERMGITVIKDLSKPRDRAKLTDILTGVEQVQPMEPLPTGFDWVKYTAYEPY